MENNFNLKSKYVWHRNLSEENPEETLIKEDGSEYIGYVEVVKKEDVKEFIRQRDKLDLDLLNGKIDWGKHTIEKIKLSGFGERE